MRLFLAVPLPQNLHDALLRQLSILRETTTGWRWVRPEGLHLTLRFLGEVGAETDRVGRVRWGAVARVVPAPSVSLGGLGVFLERGRARVLWASVLEHAPGGALERLAKGLELAAREIGLEPERRPFHPHVTLGRASRTVRPARPRLEPAPSESGATTGTLDRLVLFRSELERSGARYTPLGVYPIGRRES